MYGSSEEQFFHLNKWFVLDLEHHTAMAHVPGNTEWVPPIRIRSVPAHGHLGLSLTTIENGYTSSYVLYTFMTWPVLYPDLKDRQTPISHREIDNRLPNSTGVSAVLQWPTNLLPISPLLLVAFYF